MRYSSFFFGTCDVRLLAFSFVQLQLLVATILHRAVGLLSVKDLMSIVVVFFKVWELQ